jgi:NNP family nitrate/nitrite transporter-like MFS transporter
VTSFPELILLGLLLGIAGTSFAVALPLASRAYPLAHQGLAMGVAGSGNSGAIFSLALAPVAAERIGWHAVFGATIPIVLVTLLVYGTLARDHDPLKPSLQSRRDLRNLLRTSDIYWFCLLYSVTFGGFVGFSSYLSIFFFDQYGLSRIQAGWVAAACALAGSFSRPIGGYLADHWGGLRTLAVLYPTIAVLAGIAALLLPFTETFASVLLLMVGLGLGNGVIFQVIPLRFREEIGRVSGLVGAAGGVGGFFLPSVLGLFRDLSGTYAAGFGLFAAFCGLLIPVIVVFRNRMFAKAYTGI